VRVSLHIPFQVGIAVSPIYRRSSGRSTIVPGSAKAE
jgi:hypothetical protein